MTTQLIKCTCKSEFQDSLYGQNVRVGNCTSGGQFRCTVCSLVSGTKATASIKMPVITEAPPTKAEEKKAGADDAKSKKASGGSKGGSGKTKSKKAVHAGGSKDIKKEPKKKKSMKGTKR